MGIFLAVLVLTMVFLPVVGADSGVYITGYFEGTPQYNVPAILNAGTLTLTARLNGATWGDLDDGQMSVEMSDGRQFKIRNMWQPTEEPGEYRWMQYLPPYVRRLWIENPQVDVRWEEFGPFAPSLRGGIEMVEQTTYISVGLELVDSGKTWRWKVVAQPAWAAAQWPWWDEVSVALVTNCRGDFSWEGVYPGTIFEVKIPHGQIADPNAQLAWVAARSGWTQDGLVQGPVCKEK
jgi:hypothetical protein